MPAPTSQVQRQRRLPWSMAVEIAWKQIRIRLGRSLLVTAGIVLAIAFVLAIRVGDLVIDGMRDWIAQSVESPEFAQLRQRQAELTESLRNERLALRDRAMAAPAPSARPLTTIDLLAGATWAELRDELGGLPADPAVLDKALASDPEFAPRLGAWISHERELRENTLAVTRPKQLESLLAEQGVPTHPADIAAARLQQRWLLGLALLVSFVGILNAMLMSVTERFREIGTMKCLGALDGFIVKLFLIESLFQGAVGTLVGIIVGLIVSLSFAYITYGPFAFVNLPLPGLLGAIALSAAVGIILTILGALLPARQAARMHPIAAMRVEA